jgi:acyl-coenzyme A thioesterase PaaI-like protein
MTTERIYVPTLELKTSFLGAAYAGLLYAEARCIKFGKSIAFMEAELMDGEGKILAKMSTTAAPRLLKAKPNLIAVEPA